MDAQFEALLALRAEGISVAVGLNARAVSSGVVSRLAEAGGDAIGTNSGKSVSPGVARSAGSGGSRAGQAFRVALGAGTSQIGVVEFIVAVDTGTKSAREISEFGSVARSTG